MKEKYFLLYPLRFVELVFFLLLFDACKTKTNTYEPKYTLDSSQKKTLIYNVPTQAYYEMHTPFVNYLNQHLPDIHIQIVAHSNFSEYVSKVNSGLFDLAIGHGILVFDIQRLGHSFIGESVGEEPNAGAILVHKDSLINTYTDLKGRSIATPGRPALPGHMLQMICLLKNGLDVNKEIKLKQVESFESVVLNIYLGKCSAGFTSTNGWHGFIKKRPEIASKVALKWVTEAAPGNTILVNKDVNEETINQLENLVLTMHMNKVGRQALADLGYAKFVHADINNFLPLKKFMKEYNELIVDPKY